MLLPPVKGRGSVRVEHAPQKEIEECDVHMNRPNCTDRKEDCCEHRANLGYIVTCRTAGAAK